MRNGIIYMVVLFSVFENVCLSSGQITDTSINTDQTETVTIQRDLYNIFINLLQRELNGQVDEQENSNIAVLERRIMRLESKLDVYEEERLQLYKYADALTIALGRLTKLENDADITENTMRQVMSYINDTKIEKYKTDARITKTEYDIDTLNQTISEFYINHNHSSPYVIIKQEIREINDTTGVINRELAQITRYVNANGKSIRRFEEKLVALTDAFHISMDKPPSTTASTETSLSTTISTPAVTPKVYADCLDIYKANVRTDGLYNISSDGKRHFVVYCDMSNGGWTLIQRRISDSVNFSRRWSDYENGFGDLSSNFWLGLKNIHQLTSSPVEILIEVVTRDTNETATMKYNDFYIDGPGENYTMHINRSGIYNSVANKHRYFVNDGLGYQNNGQFGTFDHHDKGGCVIRWKAANWYTNCWVVSLNGPFNKMAASNGLGEITKSQLKIKRSM